MKVAEPIIAPKRNSIKTAIFMEKIYFISYILIIYKSVLAIMKGL
jgi:hypothetical protein